MTGRSTRRGALALLGALAGCTVPNPLSPEPSPAELDGAALRAAVAEPAPTYRERLPVAIDPDHLAASERRARSLVESVPGDLGPAAIPNGAIRERVRGAREHAVDALSRATDAPTPFERLESFAGARADARFAAGAWRAIDDGLAREDLAGEAAQVREDRRAVRERWRYVGGDPVDATLVHAAIEDRIGERRGDVTVGEPRRYRPGNPLGVGEVTERIERARVAVDDAAHLDDRLRAAVDDPVDLRPRLAAGLDRLRTAFDAARDDLPPVEDERHWTVDGVDTEGTPAAAALRELSRPIDDDFDETSADEFTLARSILWAHASFVSLAAFESLRERVAGGETFAVESAADVAPVRSDAVAALRDAHEHPREPALTRRALATSSRRLGHADDRLADAEGTVRAAAVRDEVATYLVVAARARAMPPASERVAAALRS